MIFYGRNAKSNGNFNDARANLAGNFGKHAQDQKLHEMAVVYNHRFGGPAAFGRRVFGALCIEQFGECVW